MSVAEQEKERVVGVVVKLEDDVWGNINMWAIAAEVFEFLPDIDYVEVQEHAGWWLAWTRVDNPVAPEVVEVLCVGSANDTAEWVGRAKEWRRTHVLGTVHFLGRWHSHRVTRKDT